MPYTFWKSGNKSCFEKDIFKLASLHVCKLACLQVDMFVSWDVFKLACLQVGMFASWNVCKLVCLQVGSDIWSDLSD
jgi:hypothetical protein